MPGERLLPQGTSFARTAREWFFSRKSPPAWERARPSPRTSSLSRPALPATDPGSGVPVDAPAGSDYHTPRPAPWPAKPGGALRGREGITQPLEPDLGHASAGTASIGFSLLAVWVADGPPLQEGIAESSSPTGLLATAAAILEQIGRAHV